MSTATTAPERTEAQSGKGKGRRGSALRFDRRSSERHTVAARVSVLRRSHDLKVYQCPVCSIQLYDMSDGGLGARCEVPLQPDEPVAIFFPPHGAEGGMDLYGHIVRCEPGDNGYRLGIQFDCAPAA